jgi:hypothetical protein
MAKRNKSSRTPKKSGARSKSGQQPKPSTTGSVAANLHEGSRSEIIADYLFASWGTVTPVRRQDDHGLDLYCTVTDRIGQRAIVTDYYAVQVKSGLNPLEFATPESVKWFVENPNPLFLACVDKKTGVLRIYQLMVRYFIAIGQLPQSLAITLEDTTEGRCISGFDEPDKRSTSAPILKISWADILDDQKMNGYRDVLRDWIQIDRGNLDLRASGLLRFQMPVSYKTNQRLENVRTESGNVTPDDAQMGKALETLVQTLDCVGHQLSARKDRKAALYGAILLRHLRTQHAAELPPRWQPSADTSLEKDVRRLFNLDLYRDDPRWRDTLDMLENAMLGEPGVAEYLQR